MSDKNQSKNSVDANNELAATIARLRAEQAELIAQNVALKAAQSSRLTCKVSAKGAVSVYGLGRWPVTLYGEQWTRLLEYGKTIEAYIKANQASLSVKADHKTEDKPVVNG